MEYTDAQIERIGTSHFVERLYQENIKVSYPDIDDGVDLIAYVDRPCNRGFQAVPIQVKCYRKGGFYSDRKYQEIAGLFIVYIWNVIEHSQLRAFCMRYESAEAIVDSNRWSRKDGRYVRSEITKPLLNALQQYEVVSLASALFGK